MASIQKSNDHSKRLRGATVARLTPDQKAACSNHVGVKSNIFIFSQFESFLWALDAILKIGFLSPSDSVAQR